MVNFSDPGKVSIPYEIRASLEHLRHMINGREQPRSEREDSIRNWVRTRDSKEKDALHSWAVAILEDRISRWDSLHEIIRNEDTERLVAVLVSSVLWSNFVREALTKFVLDSFHAIRKEKVGSPEVFGYVKSQTVSLALQAMLEAGMPSKEVENIASLLWELGPVGMPNFNLRIESDFTKLLIERRWCFPHLLWEIWRQNLQGRSLTHWLDTAEGSRELIRFWQVFSRTDAEPFFDLFELLHELQDKYRLSEWEERGKVERLRSILESKPDLLSQSLSLVLSAYGDQSSLVLTLITLGFNQDVFDSLKAIRDRRIGSALGDISRALIAELEGEISESQEKWISYWHRDFRRLLTPDFPRLVSVTWAQDARIELPIYAAFSQADERFSRWILANYALNEGKITRHLLDLLCEEGNSIKSTLLEWAKNRKQQLRIQLGVIDHEAYRREKRTRADLGLILEVNAHGMIQMKRACLIQAKKASIMGKSPRPKWTIDREQLEMLIDFGDGGLYWLYGLGPGILILPARLLRGILAESKADICTLAYSRIANAARPLASFLVYDFISGWIGEISQNKIDIASGEGDPGIGPDLVLRVSVTIGEG